MRAARCAGAASRSRRRRTSRPCRSRRRFDDDGELRVASVGRNDVDVQRWGRGRVPLGRWPGEAAGPLVTLWFPLTEGDNASNRRWRIALASTGPVEVGDPRDVPVAVAAPGTPPPTGRPGALGPTGAVNGALLAISALQRNVVVERFQHWLSFPAKTYVPKREKVLDARPGETTAPGRRPAKRSDTRLDRLEGVKTQLVSLVGFAGPIDAEFLRALIDHGGLTPSEVSSYPELDLALLADLGLLWGRRL